MKSLLLFWREVLVELGTWCRVSTDQDFKTVLARFEKEGDEFLTLRLPEFGKDLEKALDQGQVTPDLFSGFRKRQKLPIFLGGFMELLFDRASGSLLDVEGDIPSAAEAVFAIRQLTLMFGKVLKPCTPEREAQAFVDYVECEKELRDWEEAVEPIDMELFRQTSNLLFRDVLTELDSRIHAQELYPKHGPGSTADRLSGNQKYDQVEWTDRLESVFPYGEYAIPNWRYYYLLDRVQFLEPGAERPVRVIAVPKTQKTPRIIAIEPTCMQYMQQAISRDLVNLLETDLTVRGMIGFDDQLPNQKMAQYGSSTGSLATLDLSEASDRVSWSLVRWMTSNFGNLQQAIDVTRSTRADVPGHGVLTLSKYASMGSALCFPIEAMVFLTCVFIGIADALNEPVKRSLIKRFRNRVRVYGDDIIIPNEFATAVNAALARYGFKVNDRKSFWTGSFRESCGAEFFYGEDVSITRVRRDLPHRRTDVQEVISTVSLRNQMYMSGLWRSAKWLDELLGDVMKHLPAVAPTSPVVGRHSLVEYDVQRVDEALQAPLVKGYVVNSQIPRSPIEGEGALLKCLLMSAANAQELSDNLEFLESIARDPRHLEREGRPDAVRLKLRWASPF